VSRSILLIDDDAEVLSVLGRFFERLGWEVLRAAEAAGATALYERERPDLVLLDLHLPGLSGLELLDRLRARDPDATVIMLTGHGDIATAVRAMRLGAENFLTKPVELVHLEAAADRAFEKVELRRRARFFAERKGEPAGLETLGRSPAMLEIARQVQLLAGSDATALLLGETGTGKGWVAHLLHALSRRSAAPFVEINCAGLSATFLHSEMFGHEKGAFTDARERKRGLFEVAHGGTVFLDEIGDLAPELQPRLLKVLESRKFRRLGGNREIDADVRLVAATNRELEAAVRARTFREDLYYRLAVLPLRVPPLRDRGRDEIADLAVRLLAELRRNLRCGPDRISTEAMALLQRYAWPGNVRELRNVLERVLLVAADADEIGRAHLPPEVAAGKAAGRSGDPSLSLEEVERRHVAHVLAHHAGNRSRTARTLGIARATLYEKLSRYGLDEVGRTRRRPESDAADGEAPHRR
jgi:DNA-binding NtrC family response regulator